MNLDTKSYEIAKTINKMKNLNMKLRWVCVIQKNGIENEETLTR